MMVEVSSTPLIVTTTRTIGDAPSRGTYGRVTAWLAKRVEFALAQVDLTLPQYRVLGILVEGSAAASGLAGRLAVRRVLEEADLAVDAYMVSIAGHLPDADEVMVLRSLELWGQALANFHQLRAAQSK
jgi:hypothetical protein